MPEGLISLLENFSLKADEKADDARSRIDGLLWAKLSCSGVAQELREGQEETLA